MEPGQLPDFSICISACLDEIAFQSLHSEEHGFDAFNTLVCRSLECGEGLLLLTAQSEQFLFVFFFELFKVSTKKMRDS